MAHAVMSYLIEMICVVFIVAYLLPPAITAIMAVNTSAGVVNITGSSQSSSTGAPAWNAGVVSIFQILLPILVIITIALALMPAEIKSKVGL